MRLLNKALYGSLASAFAMIGLASTAFAATTATATIPVSATVVASCTITATSAPLDTYTASTTTAATVTGTVSPTCTNTTPYQITMNDGLTGTSAMQRQLSDGAGDTLNYNVYSDAGFTQVWGDGTTGTAVSGTGTGSPIDTSYYIQVPAGQYVTPGSYNDTLTVTVSW